MPYRALARLSGDVLGGRQPAETLLARMRAELGTKGEAESSRHLRRALDDLRGAMPDAPHLDIVERDVRLLEERHG